MKLALLGSGSKGNATIVQSSQTTLMIDCGFSAREATKRLAQLDLSPTDIDAILVTHEHSDHAGGVASFSNSKDLPVWMTRGSYLTGKCGKIRRLHWVEQFQPFVIGDIEVQPYPVPHDAREACQYVFHCGQSKLGMLTDAGSITGHMIEVLQGCDGLLLESNHDPELLKLNRQYPQSLKQRILGDYGHLSNHQAAELLRAVHSSRLQWVVAAHLSEDNNSHEQVDSLVASIVDNSDTQFHVAEQHQVSDWYFLNVMDNDDCS